MLEDYEVVGRIGASVHKEGITYSVRDGIIILKAVERGESLDSLQNLCCVDVPKTSEVGRKLPRNRADVLFQSGVVLS